MTKTSILNLLAASALTVSSTVALAAPASDSDFITVSQPRTQVEGRSSMTGARIVRHSVSVAVGVRDLDLRTDAGWSALDRRVRRASRLACDALQRQIPIDTDSAASSCPGDARRVAMRAAVLRGEALATAGTLNFTVR